MPNLPAAAAAPFRFDRAWTFAISPEAFWELIQQTENFPRWWRWLRAFDADGLHPGAQARFEVRGPLPYTLRFELDVVEVVACEVVDTVVQGDLEGSARLDLVEAPGGCRAHLRWSLTPANRMVRRLARVARPLMAWSHDQIVQAGVQQFERAALSRA